MTRNKSMFKWLVPVATILSPLWLGYLPYYLGILLAISTIQYFGLAFILVSMQYAIVPYESYFSNNGHIPHYWLATFSHWAIVLFAYAVLSKKRSLVASLVIFAGLFIGSIVFAHALLNIFGFRLSLDGP